MDIVKKTEEKEIIIKKLQDKLINKICSIHSIEFLDLMDKLVDSAIKKWL